MGNTDSSDSLDKSKMDKNAKREKTDRIVHEILEKERNDEKIRLENEKLEKEKKETELQDVFITKGTKLFDLFPWTLEGQDVMITSSECNVYERTCFIGDYQVIIQLKCPWNKETKTSKLVNTIHIEFKHRSLPSIQYEMNRNTACRMILFSMLFHGDSIAYTMMKLPMDREFKPVSEDVVNMMKQDVQRVETYIEWFLNLKPKCVSAELETPVRKHGSRKRTRS